MALRHDYSAYAAFYSLSARRRVTLKLKFSLRLVLLKLGKFHIVFARICQRSLIFIKSQVILSKEVKSHTLVEVFLLCSSAIALLKLSSIVSLAV